MLSVLFFFLSFTHAFFFFFNDTATTEIYTLSLHDALPISFAVAGDAVWSAIDEKPKRTREPARLSYLRRRPEAALCVDRYDDDWDRLAWVQLLGTVRIVEAAAAPGALAALAARYEPYRMCAPPGPLLRF